MYSQQTHPQPPTHTHTTPFTHTHTLVNSDGGVLDLFQKQHTLLWHLHDRVDWLPYLGVAHTLTTTRIFSQFWHFVTSSGATMTSDPTYIHSACIYSASLVEVEMSMVCWIMHTLSKYPYCLDICLQFSSYPDIISFPRISTSGYLMFFFWLSLLKTAFKHISFLWINGEATAKMILSLECRHFVWPLPAIARSPLVNYTICDNVGVVCAALAVIINL